MSTSLQFLAYASSATHQLSADELIDLLSVCRSNNARDDLSGMLLYRGGNFLQALEGPEEVIHATMQRIARDPRHRAIVHLYEDALSQRVFGDWSMGFTDADKLDPTDHPGLNYFLSRPEADASANTEHDVFEFFNSFREHMV
jgi:hypothetical protein